jgi:hypothetical protein
VNTFFKSRTLTVSSIFVKNLWSKPTINPKLTLSGKWMQEAGFLTGEKVKIEVSQNTLIITKI